MISLSTRIFTKTKSQVSLVVNKVRQEIWDMWLQDWLKITRSITVYTLLHKLMQGKFQEKAYRELLRESSNADR